LNCLYAPVFTAVEIDNTSGLLADKISRKYYLQHIKALLGITKTTLKPSGESQLSEWYKGAGVLEEPADSSNLANESSTFLQHLTSNLSIKTMNHDAVHRLEVFKEKFPNLDVTSKSVTMKQKFPTWSCSLALNSCRFLGRSNFRSHLAEATLDAKRCPK